MTAFGEAPDDPPGVDRLLQALSFSGVPVGPTELLRLRQVFSLRPGVGDREELSALLACILVRTDAERRCFERVFQGWWASQEGWFARERTRRLAPLVAPLRVVLGDAGGSLERARRVVDPEPERVEGGPPAVHLSLRLGKPAEARTAGEEDGRETEVPPEPSAESDADEEGGSSNGGHDADGWAVTAASVVGKARDHFLAGASTIKRRLPAFVVEEGRTLGLMTVLAAMAGAAWLSPDAPDTAPSKLPVGWALVPAAVAVGIGRVWRGHTRMPDPVALPGEGPRVVPDLPGTRPRSSWLDPKATRTLVWNIGQVVSDDRTHNLDVPATVYQTARHGTISLVHERLRVGRQVWLWVDEAVDATAQQRFAEELAGTLRRSAVHVRVARFVGIPEQLWWEEQGQFTPAEVEGDRGVAMVVVLTDGRALRNRLATAGYRLKLAPLLRSLVAWPHLVVVDTARGRYQLAEVLAPWGLACIGPAGVVDFLAFGGVVPPAGQPTERVGNAQAWAAAMAFPDGPVHEDATMALRQALRLDVSPWEQPGLAAPTDRARLLAWLLDADPGLFWRAQAFWVQHLDRQEEAWGRRAAQGELVWAGSLAEQQWRLERSFLRLWGDPEGATSSLYALFGGALREEVRRRMRGRAPGEGAASGLIVLPWLFAAQPERVRRMLVEMDLGGLSERVELDVRLPARLLLAIGLCVGIAVGIALRGW